MSLMLSYNVTSIILQITLVITFITVFFFVYGTYIEKQIVISQVNNVISDLGDDLSLLLTPDQQVEVRAVLQNISQPETSSDQDVQAMENNNKLIKQSAIVISCLFFAGIAITIYLIITLKLNWWYIVKNSMFGIGACVITEFIFLTFFVANYRSLDPNKVKLSMVESLTSYANS